MNQMIDNSILVSLLKSSNKESFDNNDLLVAFGIVNKNFTLLNNKNNLQRYVTLLSEREDVSKQSIKSFVEIVNTFVTRPILNSFLRECGNYGIKIEDGYRLFRDSDYRDVFKDSEEYDKIQLIIDAICYRYHVKSIKSVKYDLVGGDIRAFYYDIQTTIKKYVGCDSYKACHKFDYKMTNNNLLDIEQSKFDINKTILHLIKEQDMSYSVKKDKIDLLIDSLININTNYNLIMEEL
jgi:hypothetical protein